MLSDNRYAACGDVSIVLLLLSQTRAMYSWQYVTHHFSKYCLSAEILHCALLYESSIVDLVRCWNSEVDKSKELCPGEIFRMPKILVNMWGFGCMVATKTPRQTSVLQSCITYRLGCCPCQRQGMYYTAAAFMYCQNHLVDQQPKEVGQE